MCHLHIGGGDYDRTAVQLFQGAADRGLVNAQYSLGICYLGEVGVQRCYQEAQKYLLQAARQGNIDAQLTLNLRHDDICGHYRRVSILYQYAADKEDATAQQLANDNQRKVNSIYVSRKS